MPASQISPPPKKDGDTFDDWLFKFWTLVASATASLSHAALSSLAWTSSKHTGTASKIAAFDGSGNATELTESGTGNVAMTTSPVFTTPNIGSATGSISGNAATVTTNANLTGPITSSGNATAVASQTGTGSKFVMDTSPSLITPVLGVATGTSVALTGALSSSSPTAGLGYVAGSGGAITQNTSKATAVTLNKICGQISTAADALAANTTVTFQFSNSVIANNDCVILNIASGGTTGAYQICIGSIGGGTCNVNLTNVSSGSLSQSLVINFLIIKAVHA